MINKTISKKVSKKILNTKRLEKNANRRIARANAAFAKMSKAQKRVAIAKDVLQQIAVKRFIPRHNAYLSFDSYFVAGDTQLQDVLKDQKKCEGCALGSLFMCAIEKADKLKVNQLSDFNYNLIEETNLENIIVDQEDTIQYLKKYFSLDQLSLIERVFESWESGEYYHPDIQDSTKRMKLIMQNIIDNKGTFVMPKKKK